MMKTRRLNSPPGTPNFRLPRRRRPLTLSEIDEELFLLARDSADAQLSMTELFSGGTELFSGGADLMRVVKNLLTRVRCLEEAGRRAVDVDVESTLAAFRKTLKSGLRDAQAA
jgi:hypothetical protein